MATGRHLLVDGFNAIHAHAGWRELLRRDQGAAMARLVEDVRVLHDAENWRLTIVFDSQESRLQVEQPSPLPTLAVVYTPAGVTADAVIERLLARSQRVEERVVATDDRAIQQTALSNGAQILTCAELGAWINRAVLAQTRRLQQKSKQATFLNSIFPET